MKGLDNIHRLVTEANDVDVQEGKVAYYRYLEVCHRVSGYFPEYTLEQIVAVFVALSPNNDYKGNLKSTLAVLTGHRRKMDPKSITTSTYGHCRDRAYSYLDGVSFLETSKGKKIRAFYRNILNPLDPEPVTIDGHAFNAWRNEVTTMKDVATRMNGSTYDLVATDFRKVGKKLGLIPNQVQAICWFAWKRKHRILSKVPQLHLFVDKTQDFWETASILDDILWVNKNAEFLYTEVTK